MLSEGSRRIPREAVDCQSRISGATMPPSTALIVNISPHGCMVRCDQAVSIGEGVTVDMPGLGSLRGFVIWSLGKRIGIEFETMISLETYLMMLALMKSSQDNMPPA
jgi:hypothetical protein